MAASSSPSSDALPIDIVRMHHAVGGYLHGLTQPFLLAHLRFNVPQDPRWAAIDEALCQLVPLAQDGDPSADPFEGAVQRVIHWTAELQRQADHPVFEMGGIFGRPGETDGLTAIALPTIQAAVAMPALRIVTQLINQGVSGALSAQELADASRSDVEQLTQLGRRQQLGSSNMIKFLEAAHQRGTPWLHLGGNAYQVGYGARGRWLDATFTDETPRIGAALARDKMTAAMVLRHAGLPVPSHIAVHTEDGAVNAAQKIGYPVVVKPFDKDGGIGVFAGLKTEAAVRKAFGQAKEHSKNLVVEQYIEGDDHRMFVFQGELTWALKRVPGGVRGDGKQTVRQLVDQFNDEPIRKKGAWGLQQQLKFDEEAMDWLAERGLDGESVPAEGEWIRLRGAANIGRGGVPTVVFDQVHPDNKWLAERAAKALRLDIAGVDLIVPDISRSFRETGGAICEVNAQPTIGVRYVHLYEQVLQGLLKGDGRIPIATVVGAAPGSQAAALLARILRIMGLRTGIATPDGVSVGDQTIVSSPIDPFSGGRVLVGDQGVDAAVLTVNDMRPLTTGLPFDRCTVLGLAGTNLAGGAGGVKALGRLSQALAPMSLGRVVIDAACAAQTSSLDPRRVLISAAGEGVAAARAHAAKNGAAVWVIERPDGPHLVGGQESATLFEIALARDDGGPADLVCSGEDIAMAASMATVIGCRGPVLERALAGVRLAAQAKPARQRAAASIEVRPILE